MKELFLLGAGASVEAGIPDAYKMSKVMLEQFSNDPVMNYHRYDKALTFVIAGLIFKQGIIGNNPYNGINIEDLFNSVALLGNRNNSEISPFINSWHPEIINLEKEDLSHFDSEYLLKTINEPIEKYVNDSLKELNEHIEDTSFSSYRTKRIDSFFASSDFAEKFSLAVRQITSGNNGKLFTQTAQAMVSQLIKLVWLDDDKKISYLLPLIRHAHENKSIFVTLNYDNTIELGANSLNFEVDTGFDSWSKSTLFTFERGKIPLLKLHGSIDWELTVGKMDVKKPLPYNIINKIDPSEINGKNFKPAVIFGGKNKLTTKGPFISLLNAFQIKLLESEVLTIIGYSFRDEHVNEYITNWFNGLNIRKIRIINPNIKSLESEFARNLLHSSISSRVEIIEEITSVGVSKII